MKRWTVLSAALAALVYALMWIGWAQNRAWLAAVDRWALGRLHGVGLWDWLCTAFGPMTFRIAALVLIVLAFVHARRRIAWFLVLSIELSGLVTEVAKSIADRSRPDTQMVYAFGSSFPSGHAVGVMVGVLALLTVAWPVLGRWRLSAVLLGALVIVAVGVGRVALNVHHPSDVLAGWALGYVYYLLCVRLVPPYGRNTGSAR